MSSFTARIPGAMPSEDRLQRAQSAAAVTNAVPGAPVPENAAPASVGAPATSARPWEVRKPSGLGKSQRIGVSMPASLRAKLEYLESVTKGVTKSDIISAGILAECLRIEKDVGVLPAGDMSKVRERVQDRQQSAIEGATRMVVMVTPELRARLEDLKVLGFASTLTAVVLAGAEDEANRRLKARGEL